MVSFTRVISLCFATQTWRRRLCRYRQRYSLSDKYLFIFHASREINYKLLRTPNVPPVNVSRVSRILEYPGPPPATLPPVLEHTIENVHRERISLCTPYLSCAFYLSVFARPRCFHFFSYFFWQTFN